jgi:PAS domain S-box-containing protein
VVANDNGIYVEANEAACAFFGGTREDVIGASLVDFIEPSRATALKAQ